MTTPHPKILRAQEDYLSEIEVANMLRDLQTAIELGDVAAARRCVLRWIADNAFDEDAGHRGVFDAGRSLDARPIG